MRVIAVAGGSASGKTTFAQALAGALAPVSVEILSADKYSRKNQVDAPSFRSPTTGEVEFDWNHPDSYDYAHLLQEVRNSKAEVVIVEGLMVLHDAETRELADFRIYVELRADERALRRMLRDMSGGRASTDPQFIARYYLESARIGHDLYVEPSRRFADVIVRGDADFNRVARLLACGLHGIT